MTSGGTPVLLLVGSGVQLYRQYLMEGAASVASLWLLEKTEPTWQASWVDGGTAVDVTDVAALVAAGAAVAAGRPVAGVLCWDEGLILQAAHLREALGLPGTSVAGVSACRDKRATRAALAGAGVPQPRSIAVASLAEARTAAGRTGYPLVLKPRGLGASQGVARVDGPAGLEDAYARASAASYPGVPVYDEGVLVEECLEGPEISVDGFALDGRYEALFVARKRLGFDPWFEEVGHVVSADDLLLADRSLLQALAATHAALGAEGCVTHTELRLTPGGPRVIEVNGRLGGDLIPYLGQLATGIDPGAVAAELACGRRPAMAPTRRRSAAVRFLYPPEDCVVESVDVSAVHWPAAVEDGEVRVQVEPGTELRLPPRANLGRYAILICCAPEPAEAEAALEAVADDVVLRWRAAGAHRGG